MESNINLNLTEAEAEVLQKLVGFVMYHTSPELFSVACKLHEILGDDIDYSDVVFNKTDEGGSIVKTYNHQRFVVSIK